MADANVFTLRLAALPACYSLTAHDAEQRSSAPLLIDLEICNQLIKEAEQHVHPHGSAESGRALGQRLFQLIFREPVGSLFHQARGRTLQTGRLLRLSIVINEASELYSLPWEFLHDGQGFLTLDHAVSVERMCDTGAPARALLFNEPLRVLLTSCAPKDAPPLDPSVEVQTVRAALAALGRPIELVVLHDVEFGLLHHRLVYQENQGQPFQIWHHLGHSRRSTNADGQPVFNLVFNDNQHSYDVPMSHIVTLTRACPSLCGVVLAACRGADSDGLTLTLSSLGLPFVVGFRGITEQEVTRLFAQHFYGALAAGVDRAMLAARRALYAELPRGLAWAAPLLFLRALATQPQPEPVRPTAQPEPASAQRRQGLTIGNLKTRDLTYVGTAQVGRNAPPSPASVPADININTAEVDTTTMVGALSVSEEALKNLAHLRQLAKSLAENE